MAESLHAEEIMTDCLGDLLNEESVDYSFPDFSSAWPDDCSTSTISEPVLLNAAENLDITQVLNDVEKFITSESNKGVVVVGDQSKEVKPAKTKKNILKKGQRYTESFKRKVLEYSVKHTFKETAEKFNVNSNTVTEWNREYKRLLQLKLKKSTTVRSGSKHKTDLLSNSANLNETDRHSEDTDCAKFLDWLKSHRLRGVQLRKEDVLAAGLSCLPSETDNNDVSNWFSRWVCRLSGNSNNTTGKHIFYPDKFKLEVALYAKEYTKMKAAQVFGISSRRIYAWCTPESVSGGEDQVKLHVEKLIKDWYEERLAAGNKPKGREVISEAKLLYEANGIYHMKCSHGWLDKFQKRVNLKMSHVHDDNLLMWVLAELDNNRPLSVSQVTLKAQELAVERNFTDFKGSKDWTRRFLKRYSPLLQCWSTSLDLLPSPAVSDSRNFRAAFRSQICAGGIAAERIGCFDEVAINFNFPSEKVQTPRLIRQASLSPSSAIVILSATSSGLLLPPTIVFKGPKKQQMLYEEKVLVIYHENGMVDAQVLEEWFSAIWMRYVKAPSVLVADSFTPHMSPQFREKCAAGNCHLTIIPPGCALHLQPCSFNLARRYQETVQEEWLKHTSKDMGGASRHSLPDEMTILLWALKSYNTMAADTTSIISSFQLTGLTTPAATNGFEAVLSPKAFL